MLVFARIGGALLVLAVGSVHLYLYFDYFHRVHVVGTLFLLNAAAGAVIGGVLLLSSHPLAAAAGAGYAAATLAFFLVSVYHGLFGFTESLSGGWQEAAAGIELAAVAVIAPVLIAEVRAGPSAASLRGTAPSRRPVAVPTRTRS